MNGNIIVIGFMGSGKTTICNKLKILLEIDAVDTDNIIVEQEKMSINEIFKTKGELYFRNCETNVLKELQKKSPLIISCGGGIVMREENINIMKEKNIIILLTASPETTFNRVKIRKDRPVLNDNMNIEFITELMEKRKQIYLDVADITVATDNKNVDEICEEIIQNIII